MFVELVGHWSENCSSARCAGWCLFPRGPSSPPHSGHVREGGCFGEEGGEVGRAAVEREGGKR